MSGQPPIVNNPESAYVRKFLTEVFLSPDGNFQRVQVIDFTDMDDSRNLSDSTSATRLGQRLASSANGSKAIQIVLVNTLSAKQLLGMREGASAHVNGLQETGSALVAFLDPSIHTNVAIAGGKKLPISEAVILGGLKAGLKIAKVKANSAHVPYKEPNNIDECINDIQELNGTLSKDEEVQIRSTITNALDKFSEKANAINTISGKGKVPFLWEKIFR